MNILVVLDGNDYDEFLLKQSEKFINSHKDNIFLVYVIEVKQILEIDVQIEEEILIGESTLNKAEKIINLPKINNQAQLLQSRHKGSAIVNEIIRNDIKLLLIGTEYPKRYGSFEFNNYLNYLLKNSPCDVFLFRAKL